MTPPKANAPALTMYRCAGPNCGRLKEASNRWWLMWTSVSEYGLAVLHLCPWDEDVLMNEGTLPVCGENCAQRLQSQFMGNVLASQAKRGG